MALLDFLRGTTAAVVDSNIPKVSRTRPQKVVQRRNYAAAGNQAFVGSFGRSSGSADYELINAIEPLRNKNRSLARNSGSVKRYLQLLRDNVVGPNGFTLEVRVPKADGTPDRSLNVRVQDAFADFCEAPTVCGRLDAIELEKLIVTSWARDGEFLLEEVRGAEYADGLAFNPIEADMLDHALNTVYPSTGNQIRMGVEINAKGQRVAYHFLNQHPGDASWLSPLTKKRYRRVSADRVIHVYEVLRAGQTRGEPPMSSIPTMVQMLDGYREAEVTGRRIKSATMGFITEDAEAENGPGKGLDGMADGVSDETGDFEIDLVPGTFKKLPRGMDFKTFDPGGMDSDFAEFEGQIKTDISMGVSISPVSLGYETAKLSYSTHRGVVADDRETYKGLQSFFIRRVMRLIFTRWLRSHVAFNETSQIPPSRMLAIAGNFKFFGRGWEQIDPTKDTKAENEQLAARTTSLTRIAAKRGVSRDTLLDEIADDERALAERQLTQSFGGGNTVETTSGGGNNDEDDDET